MVVLSPAVLSICREDSSPEMSSLCVRAASLRLSASSADRKDDRSQISLASTEETESRQRGRHGPVGPNTLKILLIEEPYVCSSVTNKLQLLRYETLSVFNRF